MSFLTDEERQTLIIERMILHVVGGASTFVAQPEFEEIEHSEFFLARLMDEAASSVHIFEEGSTTKGTIERIVATKNSFEAEAQALSADFKRLHGPTSKDGAFFIFQIGTSDPLTKIVALVKYDYGQAIEQVERNGKAGLRAIIKAFIADRKAIQKACFVRTRSGSAEIAVSARDRMAVAPDLTDYFRRFLSVQRERSDQELNQALSEALREIFVASKSSLPGQDVPLAIAKAKETLRNRETIDDAAVQEAVFVAAGRPEDEDALGALQRLTGAKLRSRKIEGVEFKPDPNILRKSPRKKLKTVEGVYIEYPGDLEDGSVRRTQNPNGGMTITIITAQKPVFDELVPEKRTSLTA